MATNQGIHRSTPNSKSGRRMINIGKEPEGKLTPKQIAWNAAIDAKRALRKQAKQNSGVK